MAERFRRIVVRVMGLFERHSKEAQFIVNCTGCRRNVPAGVAEFPFQSIRVVCTLCGAAHQYRPSEIAYGVPDELASKRRDQKSALKRTTWRPTLMSLFR